MIMNTFVLNSKLERIILKHPTPIADGISSVVGAAQYRLETSYKEKSFTLISNTIADEGVEFAQHGFIGLLSRAYKYHEKIEIRPHDLWYIVLSEIALIIKANTEACRSLFTKSKDKVEITVPTDDVTQIDLVAVITKLHELIPVDLSVFMPQLSTLTPMTTMAMYAAMCDGVQEYYSYSTFMCGIPEIRVLGTEKDWSSLINSCGEIVKMFKSVGLDKAVEYMNKVGLTIEHIKSSLFVKQKGEGAENWKVEFWKSIFTSKNVGSGGELVINGWITDFYYDKRELMKLENFMTTMSLVPYKSLTTGREFVGVYGAFKSYRYPDSFLYADYGSMIFEVTYIKEE